MAKIPTHWTNESAEDFQHSIAADFVRFIEDAMDAEGVTQTELASRLGVTEGRVSQVLNNPGNLTLRKIVDYVRALKKKVAIVGYDDGDGDNLNGPIRADIFAMCWKHAGRPDDFFALNELCKARAQSSLKPMTIRLFVGCGLSAETANDYGDFPRRAVFVKESAMTP